MKNITSPRTTAISPLAHRSMDLSPSQPAGGVPAYIHEARVVDVNMVTWTVDVRTQFDQKFYANVQVSSPYMHANRGEGWYAVPEVNAKCMVCIPSDGPPPFILCFIMPMETPEDPEGDDAAEEAASKTGSNQGAVFSGGRPKGKPGDMVWRGRDGNFAIMHRGGVLQLGSTALAQRLYIPLGNIIMDISQRYEHHNVGGSVNWGLSTSESEAHPETEYSQTFRAHADTKYADVRLAVGTVHQPVPEPAGDDGSASSNARLGIGQGKLVAELVIAPGGFDAESGAPVEDVASKVLVRMFFDDKGGGCLRMEGSMNLQIKGKLRIAATEGVEFSSGKSLDLTSSDVSRMSGGKGVQITAENGAVILNGGASPVATVGSAVDILITVPVPIMVGGVAGVISTGAKFTGFVVNGSNTVLVPGPG